MSRHPIRRWACFRGGHFEGRRATLRGAMNLVDSPYLPGGALVRNESTGEEWERRRGSWFKTKLKGGAPAPVVPA